MSAGCGKNAQKIELLGQNGKGARSISFERKAPPEGKGYLEDQKLFVKRYISVRWIW